MQRFRLSLQKKTGHLKIIRLCGVSNKENVDHSRVEATGNPEGYNCVLCYHLKDTLGYLRRYTINPKVAIESYG